MIGSNEIDNSVEIDYILNQQLPLLQRTGKKEEYNSMINKLIISVSGFIYDKVYLSNNIILRCINELHSGEFHDDGTKDVVIHSIIRPVYHKRKDYYTCQIIRRKEKGEDLVYSSEEKIMLFAFINAYLYRTVNKNVLLGNNYTYIDMKEIHRVFGNKISSLKADKKEFYSNIVNSLVNDDVEIHIGSNNTNGTEEIIGWFRRIYTITDYDGNTKGYLYSFGKLSSWIYMSTSESKKVSIDKLIYNRNLQIYDFANYIMHRIHDKSKEIKISEILENLYDYKNHDTFNNVLYKKSNPSDIKYLSNISNIILTVVKWAKVHYKNINLYYNSELIDKSRFKLQMNMKEYMYLSIKNKKNKTDKNKKNKTDKNKKNKTE